MQVDADAPTPEQRTDAPYCHWLVTNIPNGAVRRGSVVVPYAPPAPPKGSPRHRYVFLLYEQPNAALPATPEAVWGSTARTHRANISVQDWAKQHGLGDAVGARYFYSEAV